MTLTTATTIPSLRSLLLTTLCTSSLFSYVHAHMAMGNPKPWDDPTAANAADRNYDIKSPLKSDGSDFPCKGLEQAQGSVPASTTYKAGQIYNTTIQGSANHNGGSCQLSLSYDNGKTWKVIKSMIGGCPGQGTSSYDFTIPMTAPSGTALFAWTWINHTGNREFYMNCAVINIEGQSDGNLCMLPNLYVADLEGINSCVSPEGKDTVFPHPGSDVVYANGMSVSSPVTGSNNCEIPAPGCSDSGSSGSSQSNVPLSSSVAKEPMSSASASRDGAGAQGSGIAQVEIAAYSASPEFTSAVEAYIASVLGASAAAATGAEGAALTSMIESYISSVLAAGTTAPPPTPPSFPTEVGSTVASTSSIATPSITATFSATSTLTSTGTIMPNATATESDTLLINSFIQSILSATPVPSANTTNNTLSSNWTAPLSIPPFLLNIFGEANVQRVDKAGIAVDSSTSCPPRPVVTQVTTAPPPATTCVTPVVACDCAYGDYCTPLNECTTRCAGAGAPSSSLWTTVVVSSDAPYPSGPPSPHPPYVSDPNTPPYLPCTPGAFLCRSPSSFFTCDQPAPAALSALATNGWAWGWERPVADGMTCLPFERVTSGGEYGAKGGGSSSTRDDRYVRARPNGECWKDGEVRCVDGGKGFWVCDQGGWVDMGAVAEGTACVGGGIVRSG